MIGLWDRTGLNGKSEPNLLWTPQDLPPSPGSGNYIGPTRRREVNGRRSSETASTTKEDLRRQEKASQHIQGTPTAGSKYTGIGSGVYTASRVRISTLLHPDPRVSPRQSFSTAWTLRKLPEEQDPALPTGTQDEKFSTDHGSSGDPLHFADPATPHSILVLIGRTLVVVKTI
ncbi:hypothetical protein ON010_g13151 [Phytophthora cinnamomi]|nr:hypothetical protein ON010_g13151 [Phytophthora cinnamomi]